MSTRFNFNGTVSSVLWNNETVSAQTGDPPGPFPTNINQVKSLINLGIYDKFITWSGSVPNQINNLTINNISNINVANYKLTLNYVFNAESGTIFNCTAAGPDTNNAVALLYLTLDGPVIITQPLEINTVPSGCNSLFSSGFSKVNYQIEAFGSFNSTNLQKIDTVVTLPYIMNPIVQNRDITSFRLVLTINISLDIICGGESLETGLCLSVCSEQSNQSTCFPSYKQYCLIDQNEKGDPNIFGSTGCFDFFSNYIQDTGPQQEIDDILTKACSAKIPGLVKFQSSEITNLEREVCACHLDPTIYANLKKDLTQEFPGSQLVAEIGQCLFNPCVNSTIKTTLTTKTCPLPACVNIAAINNNGTINNGAKIIQNDKNCESLAAKGSGNSTNNNGTTEDKKWIEKYWYWLVLGIALLVIIIIIVLVVLAGESNKKKRGNPKMLKEE